MKKIVHLIFTLEIGGSENMLVDVANEQAAYADVTIILINNKFNSDLTRRIGTGVHFYSLKREEGNKRSVWFLIKLWFLLLRIRPDIIHCHNHEIIRLLPFYKQRVVLTVHCVKIPSLHFRKYKKVYSVSGTVASEVKNRSGIISPVVINGINFREITKKSVNNIAYQMPVRDLSVRRFSHGPLLLNDKNINAGSSVEMAGTIVPVDSSEYRPVIRLVQIARLKHEMKGQDLLLLALRQLMDSDSLFRFSVDFIGSGKSEIYLRNMTTNLGLDGFVSFLGDKPRTWIFGHLHTYDILVQPSRYEAFGLAMIEGIAAGLPVIASNEPGPTDILSDKPTGYLFNSGDAKDLAFVIQKLSLQIKETGIQHLCEISRSIANEQYSIHRTAREYMRHYAADLGSQSNKTA